MTARSVAARGPVVLAVLLTLAGAGCTAPRPGPAAHTPHPGPQPQPLPQLPEPVVWIVGPVRWPVLDWHRNLTLAEALVAAEYLPEQAPRLILLHRGPLTIPIEPNRLLEGEDWALLPGDRIEIQP